MSKSERAELTRQVREIADTYSEMLGFPVDAGDFVVDDVESEELARQLLADAEEFAGWPEHLQMHFLGALQLLCPDQRGAHGRGDPL